jgi:uncharacterized protein (TIGR02466 family)
MMRFDYFPCSIYKVEAPEYLDILKQVAEENMVESRKKEMHELYPVFMSSNFLADPRVLDFGNFVAQEAWNILNEQGYAMDGFTTHFSEMWMQEHYKHSAMDTHIHRGVQIVGFYFLETPENSSKAIFFDPRPGKVITDLPQRDMTMATQASEMINFECKPGDLIMTNAWLPHSFSRHGSDDPFKFVHFNVFAQPVHNQQCQAEVI